jgi:hypothetical protein
MEEKSPEGLFFIRVNLERRSKVLIDRKMSDDNVAGRAMIDQYQTRLKTEAYNCVCDAVVAENLIELSVSGTNGRASDRT